MQLCLNRVTLPPDTPVSEFLRAAHAAGFGCVELSARRLAEAWETDTTVRDLLGPAGLVPIHGGWSIRSHWDEARFTAALPTVAAEMRLSAQLGGRSGALILPRTGITAAVVPPRNVLITRIRQVCDQAADYGLNVVLEFIGLRPAAPPATGEARTLGEALALVADVARPNAGVLIDTFHWHASGGTVEGLAAVPDGMPVVIHLNDAPPVPRAALDDDMRLLPGHGVIDLDGLVRALQRRRYAGPMSVELKSPDLHALSPRQAAGQAFTAAAGLLRRAGVDPRIPPPAERP
ncbi:sugar phosphate isomerase/epimerase family protein [Sphaerisporangium album]|uniref:sugar phosphate isomerase/epimerase family protein n=1 Tax=Sphaerisporangium album TaxID=509200 RepID=UPI0015F04404|nr:sugar phosphate isomerase/epimerase family protein [Sphaerisporangium album]